MAGEGNEITISGAVRAVVFRNEENGYAVIRLAAEEGLVFAVGCLPEVFPGEQVTLYGGWASHRTYGRQFRIEEAERRMPDTPEGIFDYLASGAIRGIGEKTAAVLVDAFGRDTLSALAVPERLAAVRGISRKKAEDIAAQYKRQMGLRDLIEFLVAHGIKPFAAARLYEVYGARARAEIEENPYLLTDDYFGVDFFEADSLAFSLGFEADSPERIEAAVLFELRHNLGNGHVFIPRAKLTAATCQLIGVPQETVEDALGALEDGASVVVSPVAGEEACYLESVYRDEVYVAARLRAMAGRSPQKPARFDQILERIASEQGVRYAALQREAIRMAAEHNVVVLTGGPGTGKTTAVKAIIAMFGALGLDTILAAPTGRAAKRMEELVGMPASTVHRLLGARRPEAGMGMAFEKNERELLSCGAVVLDEVSMMDISLTAALLRAMPQGARLVLVGDADQLPSVGPGNVFADIIKSGAVPVVRLTEIFRQAEESLIIRNAHLINEGTVPPLDNKGGDFFFLKRPSGEEAAATVVSLIAERLPKNMGIPAAEIQVLSPTRKGAAGTAELNRLIQEAVNPAAEGKKERFFGETVFRVGDRVMQIRNNYDILWTLTERGADGEHAVTGTGMFNGDVGYIRDMDEAAGVALIDFDGRMTPYPAELFGDLELAYAVTVHKAQGSEYRAVILALADVASALQVRGVLYTAVTRAKTLTVLVGDPETYAAMVANDRRQRRYSGLRARLADG